MGRDTGVARSLLLTLANVRLGYWWNSGLSVFARKDVPVKGGLWHVLSSRFALLFRRR